MKQNNSHTTTGTNEQRTKTRNTLYWCTWGVLVILFAASWYVPPMGYIDGSVLRAACILISIPMIAAAENILSSIRNGHRGKVQYGKLSAEIDKTQAKKKPDNEQ